MVDDLMAVESYISHYKQDPVSGRGVMSLWKGRKG
jgi:hypothetical protein